MIIAALAFTLMNIWVKEAGNRFELGSGELVFWRMSFAALVLGMLAKAQGKNLFTPHWRVILSRSVSGTLGMFCIFYAVVHSASGHGGDAQLHFVDFSGAALDYRVARKAWL